MIADAIPPGPGKMGKRNNDGLIGKVQGGGVEEKLGFFLVHALPEPAAIFSSRLWREAFKAAGVNIRGRGLVIRTWAGGTIRF